MSRFQTLREAVVHPLRELIGRVSSVSLHWTNRWRISPTIDRTRIDAAFWDQARRGMVQGLELAAPLLNPIYSKIASWALGRAPQFKFENAATQDAFEGWLADHHALLIEAMEESLALGTPYLLINADLSLTLLPPDVVEPLVDANDYSRVIGYRITEVYPHPDNPADVMRVTDDYYTTQRVVTTAHRGKTKTQTYANLIGRLPLVPLPNKRGLNETFGRPEAEALLTLLYEYNDVLRYAIEGNKRQGRPTPVVEKMGDPRLLDAFWSRYGRTYTYRDDQGQRKEGVRVEFDADQLLTLAGDASFKWASPASFMGDVSKLLELFFYLIVQHSELPEFIFGTAIASSKASADAQLPTFTRFIEKKQALSRRWLLDVAEIVTSYQALSQRRVQPERPTIQFEPLTTAEGALTLQSVQWGYQNGLLDDLTALMLLPVDIDNPDSVLRKAKEEASARQATFDQTVDATIARQAERLALDAPAETPDSTPDPAEELIHLTRRLSLEEHR